MNFDDSTPEDEIPLHEGVTRGGSGVFNAFESGAEARERYDVDSSIDENVGEFMGNSSDELDPSYLGERTSDLEEAEFQEAQEQHRPARTPEQILGEYATELEAFLASLPDTDACHGLQHNYDPNRQTFSITNTAGNIIFKSQVVNINGSREFRRQIKDPYMYTALMKKDNELLPKNLKIVVESLGRKANALENAKALIDAYGGKLVFDASSSPAIAALKTQIEQYARDKGVEVTFKDKPGMTEPRL